MARGRPRLSREGPDLHRRRVTHCPRGHEYSPENSYITPSGARKCRACQHEWSKRGFRRKLYGLSVEQYEFLLASQGGRCAICGRTENGGVALGVDHDHETGAIRGILCDPCNIGIGGLRDDPHLLRAAIDYLLRPAPAIPELAVPARSYSCALCGEDAGPRPARQQIHGRTAAVCSDCRGSRAR